MTDFPLDPAPAGARRPVPGLHLVATPIGTARDITLRALDILTLADVLVAEDTRTLRHLMAIHGIALGERPLLAYHDHNGAAMRPRILALLAEGRAVAYASEAGTPLVADPGLKLAQAAIAAGHEVLAAPGPSAVLAALMVAGLPTDRFLFAGFPPATGGARQAWMAELAAIPATLVIYESPRRIGRTLAELCTHLGADRPAALCRELTKRFETVERDSLGALAQRFAGDAPRGEIVLVIDRAPAILATDAAIAAAITAELAENPRPIKEIATDLAARFNVPRRGIYQRILQQADQAATGGDRG